MYRQIRLHPEDTQYQKILWRSSPDQPIKGFKLNMVTYGTASAPFLAICCLKQLADDESKEFPLGAQAFKKDFYVDDLLTGACNFEVASELRDEIIGLAKVGCLNLGQWSSNDFNLVKHLTTNMDQKAICLDTNDNKKMLGIHWNPCLDNLFYTIKPFAPEVRIIKRTILSQIAQFFDPLGLLGPVIVKAKIIMQKLWKAKIEWDESIPYELNEMWISYRNELHLLNKFNAKHRVIIENAVDFQLHGFADASETAYGACIFLRTSNEDKKHYVSLLCAKSRVAPVKTIFLPRLELCAASLLVKLYKEVKSSLVNIQFNKCRFWSDSTIVLHWIKSSPYVLKTFVANRVSDIQSSTDSEDWFCYVRLREQAS
ncbi:uncharacterized protein LOC108629224 [Ceratina calcarata]|uniref:Uncharacterized protein LOC108629224 n=1 Tax=Ceratina calcarata TaxID=156304 RepID=A0AAJ7J9D0_9HYME|nr:uncharacterized protein LOC108629224 [Ceratina calcarata]